VSVCQTIILLDFQIEFSMQLRTDDLPVDVVLQLPYLRRQSIFVL